MLSTEEIIVKIESILGARGNRRNLHEIVMKNIDTIMDNFSLSEVKLIYRILSSGDFPSFVANGGQKELADLIRKAEGKDLQHIASSPSTQSTALTISSDIFEIDNAYDPKNTIGVFNWDGENVASVSITSEGYISIEFSNGINLQDSISVIPEHLFKDTQSTLAFNRFKEVYMDLSIQSWIESRLIYLSVIYKNLSEPVNPSLDLYYELHANLQSRSKDLQSHVEQEIFYNVDIHTPQIPTIPGNLNSVIDIVSVTKGHLAKLKISKNDCVSYLGCSQGHYMKLSSSELGEDDLCHSDRVYPNLYTVIQYLYSLSPLMAEEFLKIQVMSCLSESQFNWQELQDFQEIITNYVRLVVPKMVALPESIS